MARQGEGLTMEYFKPKRPDGKSMREVMVEGLKDCDYGTIVNYKALGDILTISDKQKIQATVRVANRDLLKFYQRGLRNIPGVGYRIIEPREHMVAGERHRSKADRQMVTALQFYRGAPLDKMTEAERHLHHGQQMLAEAIYASHTHLDKRLRRVEDLLKGGKTVNEDK